MGAEGKRHVHVLRDRDTLRRTAICEACGPVTMVRKGQWWYCRDGYNARAVARNARKRGDYQHARRTLTEFLVQSGIPDADKAPEFVGMTAAQADWLYWIVRAGVKTITERHEGNPE